MSPLKASERTDSSVVLSTPITPAASLESLQKTQFALMLAAAALFGGEQPVAASLHREPPREIRVADFLKPPEGEANPPPIAEKLMTGIVFKEEQNEQRREVRGLIDHYLKNQNKKGYKGMHLSAFKELSRQDNYPATREVLNAHLEGWYNYEPWRELSPNARIKQAA